MIRNILLLLLVINQVVLCQNNKIYFDNFTLQDGLSDNYINCIFQDSKAWVWVGTGMGINRYDGIKFKNYELALNDSVSKNNLQIRTLYESKDGCLYLGLEDFGLLKYNRNKDRFERIYINHKPILSDIAVKDITEDKAGNLWVGTKSGIFKIDFKTQSLLNLKHNDQSNSLVDNYVRKLVFDDSSNLWIGTQKGLDKYNLNKKTFNHIATQNPLLNDDILEIIKDHKKRIWVGTSSNGVFIINNSTINRYLPDSKNDRSFKINSILQDKDKKFWIGTRGGLYCYDETTNTTKLYENKLTENNSLIHNSVLDIIQDAKGDLWIGTRGGLSYMVREKQVFETFKAQPNNNQYLNNSEVYAIWTDKSSNIWLGTENGGVNILNRKTGTFRYLTEQNSGLSNNCIKSINSPGDGNVFIGTFKGGLNIYNEHSGKLTTYKHDDLKPGSISNNVVWCIGIDKKQNVWIGTASGLDRFNPEQRCFEHFLQKNKLINGVSWIGIDSDNDLWVGSQLVTLVFRPGVGIINTFNEKGRGFFIDSKGQVWIMTGNRGIVRYDKHKGALKIYDENAGIASNLSYCMLEDEHGKLWISTAKGLSCFNPLNKTFKNYYNINGLQGDQFHYGAAYKQGKSELMFGGINGLNIFNPSENVENKYIPPVYITDFKIFNQSVKIDDKNAILSEAITETKKLEIPYRFNVLTFEFAALNYTNSSKNRYKYKLEGFDNDWTETPGNRSVTYTNLNPGKYIFTVIASNDKDYWNAKGASITLIISPPFYRTFWFITLIFIVLVASISYVFYLIFKRREFKKAFEFEKMQAQKLHELDLFKLQLFTNISHEIKTPLTLIISPLKKILKRPISDPELSENLKLIDKNADQLMSLVGQLLDYRKLQDGKLKIESKRGDIVHFCKDVFLSFENVMNEKGIQHTFGSVQPEIVTGFDADKLRNILNNLISNAIRYNKPGGSISFAINMEVEHQPYNVLKPYIKIVIKDSGIGISETDLPKIFNRYYSKSSDKKSTSSGIGLAFAKELIELHKGRILVESKEGQGSTFTIMLPVIDSELIATTPDANINETSTTEPLYSGDITSTNNQRILLIVEDNEDVLRFISSHFKNDFTVLEARNGLEGLAQAIKTIPDVIVSDIMMPELNGIEFCEQIKKDERTSHIPIILLTALSSNDDMKEGLITGADDYITKPFDIDLLQTKIENMLAMRKTLIEKFSKQITLGPSHVSITSPDEKFLEKAIKITEQHIDNPNLSIDTFVETMGISRMQLYRKIDALTSMTVKEFVNDIRLKRAEQILSEKRTNISEVAYACGFSDLSYFGKCFKKKFGISPSEYNLKAGK